MSATTPPPSPSSRPGRTSKRRTKFAKKVNYFLWQITDPIDVLGRFCFREWWKPFVSMVRDAIAIGCIAWVPDKVFELTSSGRKFSTLDNCMEIAKTDPLFLACHGVVFSAYCFWAIFLGRTIGRVTYQIKPISDWLQRRKSTK